MSTFDENDIPPDHPLAHIAHCAQPLGPATLASEQLPVGFRYPPSFMRHLAQHPQLSIELEPWHAEPGGDLFDPQISEQIGKPVVMFAKADLEDMVACFVIGTEEELAVVVVNPWHQQLVDGGWKQTSRVYEELPNFAAWIEWAKNSPEVQHEAEARAWRLQRNMKLQ